VVDRDDHGPLLGVVLGLAVAGPGQVEVAPVIAAARHDYECRRACRALVVGGQVHRCRYLPGSVLGVGRHGDPEIDCPYV
jgi:hypothetical protein